MISKVHKNILDYNLIKKDDTIVVGVSGGPDSMALLYVLLELRRVFSYKILVAHVNHGVRGEEALADQLFVESKAEELNLPYYFKNVDMNGYAKEKKISSEEAGRELRYGFFREILKSHKNGKIAVAHNKNDQAETLLLRIMRGTGIDGLKGMEFISEDIIRPILNISREEIESFIDSQGIETVLDKTNLVPIYNRNKVRLELLPYIRDNFNPNIVNSLWRLSQISEIDSDYLNKTAEEKYNFIVKNVDKHSIIIDNNLLSREASSMKLRIIRLAIFKILGSLQGISEQNIQDVIDLHENNKTGKQIDLPGGVISRLSYNDLIFEKIDKGFVKDYSYSLRLGENLFPDLGLSLDLSLIDKELYDSNQRNKKYFDYELIKGKLNIRNRRNGDKFIPFGMKGSKKVKDYFIDEKIARDKRDRISLLTDDENIIWIVGFATSDLYRVTENTKKILVVDYKIV